MCHLADEGRRAGVAAPPSISDGPSRQDLARVTGLMVEMYSVYCFPESRSLPVAWTVLADKVWPVRTGLAAVCTVSTVGRCTEKYCVLPLSPLQPVGRPTAPPKTAPHSVLDGEASPLCGRRYNGCLEEIERRMWSKRVVGQSGSV